MEELLPWIMMLLLLFVLMNRRQRRGSEQQPQLRYRRHDAMLLELGDDVASADVTWLPLTLEEVPQGPRRRLALTVAFRPQSAPRESLERLLWAIAGRLQEKSHAHAVVVEAFDENTKARDFAGDGVMRLLFAPDGRGWEGKQASIAELEGSSSPSRAYTLAEVHRALLSALPE